MWDIFKFDVRALTVRISDTFFLCRSSQFSKRFLSKIGAYFPTFPVDKFDSNKTRCDFFCTTLGT